MRHRHWYDLEMPLPPRYFYGTTEAHRYAKIAALHQSLGQLHRSLNNHTKAKAHFEATKRYQKKACAKSK